MVSEHEVGPRFAEQPWVSLPLSEPYVSTGTRGENIIAVTWVLGLQGSLSMSSHDKKEHHLSCPAHSVFAAFPPCILTVKPCTCPVSTSLLPP